VKACQPAVLTETTPFKHKVTPRHTEFRMSPELTEVTIQDIYGALINDTGRNEMIANDVVRALESGRCPVLSTGRTEHLQFFATRLAGFAKHVFVLKAVWGRSSGAKQQWPWRPYQRPNHG
jgi:hypothetical protein